MGKGSPLWSGGRICGAPVASAKAFLKSWNFLLKSDTPVFALKIPKKEPVAPAFTDSPPSRSTHPFAVSARLSISSTAVVVARPTFGFVFVVGVVAAVVDGDVSELVFAPWMVEVVWAVPLAAAEVELIFFCSR